MMAETKIRVPLKKVIEGIEMATDEWSQYLDIETMEIESLPDGGYAGDWMEEFEELSEQIDNGRKTRYFALPDKFDIHEYSIIERFVYDMPSGRLQDEFERAIDGRGAFRRFKSTLRYYGMEQQWYDFLYEAHREIAIGWWKPTAKSPSGGAMTTDLSTMRRMTNEAFIT